jgi:hypothetical protein
MYINRGLILIFLIIFIFAPVIQDWFGNNLSAWYRPYLAWFFVITLTYWVQRKKKNSEAMR